MELGDGTLLPVAGFGDLCLKIEEDHEDGGQTRDLMLRRVAHVPGLKHNLLSVVGDVRAFDATMATGRSLF